MNENAIEALIAEEALPAAYGDIVRRYWCPLASNIAARRASAARPLLVGINGAQGSGKSTLCRFLEALLLPQLGLSAAVLSLDDLYLPRADRQRLAAAVHPLLSTRGVPGTHDVDLGASLIERLLRGQGRAWLPQFDKSSDDRRADLRPVPVPVDVLLFEGWCVGARPQVPAALSTPVNALEAGEDADGGWRHFVNEALAGPYRRLFDPIDLLVVLQPPDFESVLENRRLQERKLRARTGRGMDEPALRRFVQHYERLTRHMFESLPAAADVVVSFDAARNVVGARGLVQ